jgi:hypothetical protein
MEDLTVFLSYAWDSQSHKDWVRKLADYLIANGINVILDQYDLKVGKVTTHFMETAIEKADKVLLILTPGYKAKAESGKSGVGYEHSIITSNLYQVQHANTKFIPVLRSGNLSTSAPGYIKTLIYHHMNNDDIFEATAFELVRILYDKPEIEKPEKGPKPDLTQTIDPIKERILNISRRNDLKIKKCEYADRYAVDKIEGEIKPLFQLIKSKANDYHSMGSLFFNSDYAGPQCRLIIDGHCLLLFFYIGSRRSFDKTELRILLFDNIVEIGDEQRSYFPGDEPNEICRYILTPKITDDLEIMWVYDNKEYSITKISDFAFSILLEHL